MFKYKIDRWPVFIILSLSAIDFALYFTVESTAALICYYLLMIVPKGTICAWNHHHQHLNTFKSDMLNRILEFFYALHTGVTTNLWVLHHNLGHHLNFLDQEKDESRWKRKDGTQMGFIEYTLNVALTAYSRGIQVGFSKPAFAKHLKPFFLYTTITFVILGMLVGHNPVGAFWIFILPMITSLILTSAATYKHHAGLDTEDEMAATYNDLRPGYNLLTGNLGYHTAHHHKQGRHWSLLPELHAQIEHKIPKELILNSSSEMSGLTAAFFSVKLMLSFGR